MYKFNNFCSINFAKSSFITFLFLIIFANYLNPTLSIKIITNNNLINSYLNSHRIKPKKVINNINKISIDNKLIQINKSYLSNPLLYNKPLSFFSNLKNNKIKQNIENNTKNEILLFVIIFTSIVLLSRILVKTIIKKLNKFLIIFFKKIIIHSVLPILFSVILFNFIMNYFFYYRNSYYINYYTIIALIQVFQLIFLGIIMSILLSYISNKWDYLEKIGKNSFNKVKSEYEKLKNIYNINTLNNNNYNKIESKNNIQIKHLLEVLEYLTLKAYFIKPFFNCLKPAYLRRDFCFSYYLFLSLVNQFEKLYNLSIISWLIYVTLVMLFKVLIERLSIFIRILFILLIPILLGIIIIIIRFYLIYLNRKILNKVCDNNIYEFNKESDNYLSNFSSSIFNTRPLYIENIINKFKEDEEDINNLEDYKLDTHITDFLAFDTNTIYENLIFLGKYGIFVIEYTVQIVYLVFTGLNSFFIYKELSNCYLEYGLIITLLIVIVNLIFYNLIFIFLICNTLKWLTLYNYQEMNKNNSLIDQTIQYQLVENSKKSNKLYQSFKKIYFNLLLKNKDNANYNNIVINDNRNKSNIAGLISYLQKILINFQFTKYIKFRNIKFKKNDIIKKSFHLLNNYYTNDEKYIDIYKESFINVKEELELLLVSTGNNNLKKEELELILHFINENNSYVDSKQEYIDIKSIYEIIGATNYFSKKNPIDIIEFVLNKFLENDKKTSNDKEYSINKVKEFFQVYNKYFENELIEYVLDECNYLPPIFNSNQLSHTIFSIRKYYQN